MAAENKPKTAPNDPKKRKRCYLPHNRPVRKKGPSPIRPGVQGFFITCDGGREFQAAQEAINVIDSFFEELIHGKCSGNKNTNIPAKPLNKKITFSYSESDEEDEEDDDDADDSKSDKPADDSVNDTAVLDETSSHAEKDDQSHVIGREETACGDKEADKEQADSKTEETEEPSEKIQPPSEVAPVEAADGEKEADNKPADEKNKTKEPPEKKQCCDDRKSESRNSGIVTSEQSIDKLIEAELQELGDKSKRRFAKLDTGCNGVVFILMRKRDGDPGPREIVQHMMESTASTKKHMSRFVLRVLPVEVSCYASEEEISKAIKPLMEQHFPANAETPVKFAVQYDARANTGIDRMKIIDAVAKSVPGPHKVDLKTPEKTIIAQVIKTVCMIGVVEKYKELAKFNLRQLTL